MGTCNHIGWFDLSGRDSLHIHYGHRAAYVIREMTEPARQHPSLIFFLGRKDKDAALREVFPSNNIRRGRCDGLVNLRLDSSTISAELPLLFADADPFARIPDRLGAVTCHESNTLPLNWRSLRPRSALHILYARLVALFSDVLCIFSDDFGGLDSVTTFLKQWVAYGNPSNLPISVRPRVVIVAREDETAGTHDVLAIENLRHELQESLQDSRASVFSSISILHLAGDHISSLARHRRLREFLHSEVELSRSQRIEYRLQFTATHFESFFRQAINHVAQSITTPFGFIEQTRVCNRIHDDYSDHLSVFLTLGKDAFLSYESLTSFIASTILMDAYPPRMHKFDPKSVFQCLYRDHCFSAFVGVFNSPMFAEGLCNRIEDHIDLFFPTIDLEFETAVQAHVNGLKSLDVHWIQLKTHHTCLYCLRRKPEHVLTCGHAICDLCVTIFGNPVASKEAQFVVDCCILCQTKGKLLARLKPPTAGSRILSIDGGGVRGVIPLEFLGLLQDILEPQLPVQDLFEQAFGTSSGGLIVLGLFLKHWEVSDCTRIFDMIIRDFFGIHITKGRGFLTHLRDLFRCWLSDGCYDISALETSLKDVFGDNRRLFDADQHGLSGQKVAVTATTLSDASTYIFSNYNGRVREKGCGYKHVRPDSVENEPRIWEAGRVTSAAPGLFKPAFIASLGSFQDGGLRHNNPMDLALWECAKIWPSPTQPDVVVSLGTGTENHLRSPKAPHFRDIFSDGFIPRLCRSFMSSLDGERAWRDVSNRLKDHEKDDYFRLNVPFEGMEPHLDDVECMETLRRSVHLQPQGARDRANIASALLVASFYFELDSAPHYELGQYHCTGMIRCRNDFEAVLKTLARVHPDQLEFMTETENLGFLSPNDSCRTCHLYHKRVQFQVRRLEDVVTISVKMSSLERRKISGFPHSMLWFVREQQIEAPFGRADHGASSAPRSDPCIFRPAHRGISRKRGLKWSEVARKRARGPD